MLLFSCRNRNSWKLRQFWSPFVRCPHRLSKCYLCSPEFSSDLTWNIYDIVMSKRNSNPFSKEDNISKITTCNLQLPLVYREISLRFGFKFALIRTQCIIHLWYRKITLINEFYNNFLALEFYTFRHEA